MCQTPLALMCLQVKISARTAEFDTCTFAQASSIRKSENYIWESPESLFIHLNHMDFGITILFLKCDTSVELLLRILVDLICVNKLCLSF